MNIKEKIKKNKIIEMKMTEFLTSVVVKESNGLLGVYKMQKVQDFLIGKIRAGERLIL